MAKRKIVMIDNDRKSLYSEEIKSIIGDSIETKFGVYSLQDFTQFFDDDNDTVTYMTNIDLDTKLEAENLKKLRRSSVINNIFDYSTKKPLDIMTLIPYVIIALMIFFR